MCWSIQTTPLHICCSDKAICIIETHIGNLLKKARTSYGRSMSMHTNYWSMLILTIIS